MVSGMFLFLKFNLDFCSFIIVIGLSRESPLGFALFGSFLVKKQDHIQLGGGFAQLANTLCKNLDSKEVVGEVMFLISEVQCFLQVRVTNFLLLVYLDTMSLTARVRQKAAKRSKRDAY